MPLAPPIIRVHRLKLDVHCGITEAERQRAQEITFDITIRCSSAESLAADDVAHTVDYDWIIQTLREVVVKSSCQLLEHLGGEILKKYRAHPRIAAATLVLYKKLPDCPLELVSVEITEIKC